MPAPSAVRPLRLMPGADVEETEAGPAPSAQLAIVYGGRALVLDDVPAERVAELLRFAAARGCTGQQLSSSAAELPVARKNSCCNRRFRFVVEYNVRIC
ncbi:hypothetical protein HU200_023663 [Digitaria exilis]|uniref:Tify domain-containing protein n=1 Tax=Digitaria exilis TaxID=1010633 RepID=A0A835C2R8_9POAL|nr:hypothetical protein HU200_023663 [Digitaria exilis]